MARARDKGYWNQREDQGENGGNTNNNSSGERLYFAQLPADIEEDGVLAMHSDVGVDTEKIVGCRLLQQKGSRRSAIVEYENKAIATDAFDRIKEAHTDIVVRFAEPVKRQWLGDGVERAIWHESWSNGYVDTYSYDRPRLAPGLRVRNFKNSRTGVIVCATEGSPGNCRVLFDDGEEGVRELSRFTTDSGMPLLKLAGEVPAAVGLRVQNWRTGRVGTVVGLVQAWPHTIFVRFDGDYESGDRARDLQFFQCEDGRYLVEAMTPTLAVPGVRVKNWKSGRAGEITAVFGEGCGRCYVMFDDGDELERLLANFLTIDGRPLTDQGPGGQDHYQAWRAPQDRWHSGDASWSAPENRWTAYDKNDFRQPRQQKEGPFEEGQKLSETELRESALREIVGQLCRQNSDGRVWVSNWPGRYQAALGPLREFLESHPEKFKIVPGQGKRYTVAFASGNAATHSKPFPKARSRSAVAADDAVTKAEGPDSAVDDEEAS